MYEVLLAVCYNTICKNKMSEIGFNWQNPVLTSLTPKTGPKSGGTTLVLMGDHLDTGSEVSVKMEGGMCEVLK